MEKPNTDDTVGTEKVEIPTIEVMKKKTPIETDESFIEGDILDSSKRQRKKTVRKPLNLDKNLIK